MLNDRSELHGSCRHTARFGWLFMRPGTDDSYRMKGLCYVLVFLPVRQLGAA
jgi:hypothetical protein